jgi:hypothetical protein
MIYTLATANEKQNVQHKLFLARIFLLLFSKEVGTPCDIV